MDNENKKPDNFLKKIVSSDIKSTYVNVTNDVVIPGVKNLLITVLKRSIDYLFTGGYSSSGTSWASGDRIDYSKYFSRSQNINSAGGAVKSFTPNVMPSTSIAMKMDEINSIVYPTRAEAEDILFKLKEYCAKYQMVSVLDYYDLIGKKTSPAINKYGWNSLENVDITSTFEGYKIVFPKIVILEN